MKRLVLKAIPDESTRLAALKRGEVDIAYAVRGELAEELRRTPGLTLKPIVGQATLLGLLPRPVGPEVAVARPARAPGRQPRHRPAGDEPGRAPGLRQDHLEHHPQELRVLLAAARLSPTIPPEPRQLLAEAGYPNGFDAGDYFVRRGVHQHRRARRQLSAGGRDPGQAPAARAGGLLQGLCREEVQRAHPGRQRRLRQRGDADRGLRRGGRHLRLRQLSRHRRALPGAGERAGPEAARGDARTASSSSSTTR